MSAKGFAVDEDILLTTVSAGFCKGRVSTGLMQATPGEIKSFRSSADKIALIASRKLHTLNFFMRVTDRRSRGVRRKLQEWKQNTMGLDHAIITPRP